MSQIVPEMPSEPGLQGLPTTLLVAEREDDLRDQFTGALTDLANVAWVKNMQAVREYAVGTFPIAIVDMNLSGGGIEFADEMSTVSPDTHVLLFGRNPSPDDLEKAIGRQVAGFVRLPIDVAKLRATFGRLLTAPAHSGVLGPMIANLHTEVRERHSMLLRSRRAGLLALARLAEHRDPETGLHVERVAAFAWALAKLMRGEGVHSAQITDEFMGAIRMAAAVHDIGKVAVPDAILRKPARLTPPEFDQIKVHCVKGWEVIGAALKEEGGHSTELRLASEVVRWHHEKWDGTGYPDGLKGDNTPLAARIVAVIDAYDAMRSRRVYMEALSKADTLAEIRRCAGARFDPGIAEVFLRHADEFELLGRNVERITARWT